MPDLTATLPTFSGTDDSLNEWVTSVENMRERCSWNDMATLNAGISRLRGRAAAWHRMDSVNLKDWHTWIAATKGVRQTATVLRARQFDRHTTSMRGEITSVKPSPRDSSVRIETANSTAKDDHQASKPTRISADTCARCLQRGHRVKNCTKPDTRTEEEKAAAAKRREERAAREQRTHRIDASATIGVKVVNDLPHDAVIGTDWRERVAFDYIERYTNGTHTLDWIPKNSPPETPEMEHRKNFTPQPAHKDDKEETDVTFRVSLLFPAFSKSIVHTCSLRKKTERSDASVRKREVATPLNTSLPERRAAESQLESPSLALNDFPSVNVASQELSLMDCTITELPLLPLENGASERCITATVQADRAAQVSSLFSVSAMDKRKWRRKERDLNTRNERLKNTVHKYKQELQKLKKECYVSPFLQVVEKAKDLAASIFVEQGSEFCRGTNVVEVTVRHAVVLHNLSTRAYEHVRSTAATKLLQEQAGHTSDASFAGVGPTVQFMDTVHHWFVLVYPHKHQKNADCKQFESPGDERLIWLETRFLDYPADLKTQCLGKNFLTKERGSCDHNSFETWVH
ncbi:hypothetical protein HPB50_015122 [Hyalomma asiaticum]|uniref:Uncharacterized protein n=1 Tax=Hyalomma asiaticum TaxID=266040 RepID=A0ACB7RJA6_HYAAI|nr:hypothetical protein HPB50_015122 [Hyalomma asiaticum]